MNYNIHHKINYKSYHKDVKFETINNEIQFDKFRECKKDYAINYSIKLHNKNEYYKMINSSKCYCSDCSHNYNKRCEHYDYEPNYLKFIEPKNSNLYLKNNMIQFNKQKVRVKRMINNTFNNNKKNDFKRSFLINNELDNEYYIKDFNNSNEARHWVINTLDLSKNWKIL